MLKTTKPLPRLLKNWKTTPITASFGEALEPCRSGSSVGCLTETKAASGKSKAT